MADLETKSDCCEPAVQETCCEPEAKSECCGEGPGCGCSAGKDKQASTTEIREVVRERYAAAAIDAGSDGASCCANAAGEVSVCRIHLGLRLGFNFPLCSCTSF